MKILLTHPLVGSNKLYFPQNLLDRISALGELRLNETEHKLSSEELKGMLSDVDVVLTHWGSAKYDGELLSYAPNLKVIAHCAGTVATIASEEAYKRGIKVLSANPVLAIYVAEFCLGVMISSLRDMPRFDEIMRQGEWRKGSDITGSLYGAKIGLVGLGAIGRELLNLLSPFGCKVKVYDPYIKEELLSAWPFASLAPLEEVMSSPIVSLHASRTPETYHMIDAKMLSLIPDGGLFINSARSSLVDTEALICELESGRINGVLDVYDKEHCRQDKRLISCKNVILQPHMAAMPAGYHLTEAIVEDLERYAKGDELKMAVSVEQFRRMTR